MRIVGGRLRGRRLLAPASSSIRPTTDRARESLFNILTHNHGDKLDGGRVLDCFAGSGALGIEALSRGAAEAIFIETSVEGRHLVEQNLNALGLSGVAKVLRRDATRPGRSSEFGGFDLVFFDPPYGKGLGEKAAVALQNGGWLKPAALLVIEEDPSTAPGSIPGLERTDQRMISNSSFTFYRGPKSSLSTGPTL